VGVRAPAINAQHHWCCRPPAALPADLRRSSACFFLSSLNFRQRLTVVGKVHAGVELVVALAEKALLTSVAVDDVVDDASAHMDVGSPKVCVARRSACDG